MQETRHLARTARAVALAAVAAITLSIATPASALDPAIRGDHDGAVAAAFAALVAVVDEWIAKAGCEIDPYGGQCHKTTPLAEVGCTIGPDGPLCGATAATTQGSTCQQTQPGQPTTQAGCEWDPWG